MELRLSRIPTFVPSATFALISLFASFVPAVAALLFSTIFLEVEILYFLSNAPSFVAGFIPISKASASFI